MTQAEPRKITLERSFRATIEDVWAMWTTKEGIESWWGPGGFEVTVQKLELVPGGDLHYLMTAVGAPQVAFMKSNNMKLSTPCRIKFKEVSPPRRLVYTNLVDFAPGATPYDNEHVVELHAEGEMVHLKLILDAMHDDVWTGRMATDVLDPAAGTGKTGLDGAVTARKMHGQIGIFKR